MRIETGLFLDGGIVELSESVRYEKCHFFGCEFVGYANRVEFLDCTFEGDGWMRVNARHIRIEGCLFVSDSHGTNRNKLSGPITPIFLGSA